MFFQRLSCGAYFRGSSYILRGENRKETCMRIRALTHPKKSVRVGYVGTCVLCSAPERQLRRTVERECAEMKLTSWATATAVAKNRDKWRQLI